MEAIRGLGNISDHEHEHSLKVIWRFEDLFMMYQYVPPGSTKMCDVGSLLGSTWHGA